MIILLAILSFALTIGYLDNSKIEPATPKDAPPTQRQPVSMEDKKADPQGSSHQNIAKTIFVEAQTTGSEDQQSLGFQVTTDFDYTCTIGDPAEAIQNAINSLPNQRTSPCNVYLQGTFNLFSSIVMADNINFIGNDATLITENQQPIFTHNQTKQYTEAFSSPFEIDGNLYQDWITLRNVTFQSINFKQLNNYDSPDSCAIYFYDGNTSGWGICDNLNVYDSSFEGFYNCIQGIAINSNYAGNHFANYYNNALMFPAGGNLVIEENIFDTPSNEFTVKQYQERDGPVSIQGGIALFLMDVWSKVLVANNTFSQGANSIGIVFSSTQPGEYYVSNNLFTGEGDAYCIDIFPRPWLSSNIVFYQNTGAQNFSYNKGSYTNNAIINQIEERKVFLAN